MSKRPQRECEVGTWNHFLPYLEGPFSLRIRGNSALSVIRTLSLLDRRTQKIVHMETKTEAIVQEIQRTKAGPA